MDKAGEAAAAARSGTRPQKRSERAWTRREHAGAPAAAWAALSLVRRERRQRAAAPTHAGEAGGRLKVAGVRFQGRGEGALGLGVAALGQAQVAQGKQRRRAAGQRCEGRLKPAHPPTRAEEAAA